MKDTFATVIGPGVVIKGSILASARAREVDIYGSVDGDVDSTMKVLIRRGGRLTGDIRATAIVIEEGAIFKGAVVIVTGQGEPAGEVR